MNNLINYLKFMHAKSKGYRRYIPLIFACSLCFSVLSIFIALIGKQLIDNLLTMNSSVIIKAIVISISAYIVGAILGFFTSYLERYVIDKFKIKLQIAFYDNMQRSEFIFFSNLSSGDVYYRMFTDIGTMVDFYLNLLITIPIKLIVFIIACGIMFSWSYQLTLAIIGLVLLQLIVMLIFRKPIKKRAEIALESEQSLISKINEDVLKSDICRSLALEEYNLKQIDSFFEISRKNKLKSAKVSLLYSSIVGLTSQIINICLLLLGIYFIYNESMTIGMLMGISMLAGYIYQPLNDFFRMIISYQPTIVSFNRFNEFNSKLDTNRLSGNNEFIRGSINLNNIYFGYSNNLVINNFSALINDGAITLLRGDNGTGKTTIMRLLTRALNPMSGNITIAGSDIKNIMYEDYRKNVIALCSTPILLNGSLRENINAGMDFSDDEIMDVIEKCCLTGVVSKLNDGLDTKLGITGSGLSQGEMQKLSLARVLIRTPQILILDEPISHIDEQSVEDILNVLSDYNKNKDKIIIIISHDNRTEQIADYIISLTGEKNE